MDSAVRIEERLDGLRQKFRVDIALIAAGVDTQQRREALLTEIKESIVLELAYQSLPEKRMLAEAEGMFLAALLGRGFSLPAAALVRAKPPRHVVGLNEEEAVGLWLGMFRQQTFGLAGLWQIYLDLEDLSLSLPEIIQQVFAPRGEEGENQEYISNVLREARQCGLELTDSDTSKIIAWVVETHPLLRARDPGEVARELQKPRSKPVGRVDQNMLRGGNTLMDEFVRCVCHDVDNC